MTDTTTGYKSAGDLPDDVRDALGALLLPLADNKRLLGIRYSDWMLGAPSVEAGIACSAMAQDEWGHARILYSMLKDFGFDPDRLEHDRQSEEYLSCALLDADVSSWPRLIALDFLLDTALTVQFEALRDSRYEPIHYKVSKLLEEERFHFDHGHGWTVRLAETEAGRGELAEAFGEVWGHVTAWFGPNDDPVIGTLADAGVIAFGAAESRARWIGRIGPALASTGTGLVRADGEGWTADAAPDWSGWSGERRRIGAGGPDEDTLARARGDRNRHLVAD
jgi:ring-1,2-phenylacetyl-CoA epoxidase subunit PaaC